MLLKIFLSLNIVFNIFAYAANPKLGTIAKKKPINYKLKNSIHPISKVRYNKNGFPIFKKVITCKLPMHLLRDKDNKQFRYCNFKLLRDLKIKKIKNKKFTKEQLSQIRHGKTPKGYTWHHNQRKATMELVNKDIHNKTAHTGGRKLWGGGKENR